MQIIHDFHINFYDYHLNGKQNPYPELQQCPRCKDRLIKHGFYQRNILTVNRYYSVYIRRYKCKHCGRTVSILPNFLIPRFQTLLILILGAICHYKKEKHFLLDPRIVFFYLKRFRNNLNGFIVFFRDLNPLEAFSEKLSELLTQVLYKIKRFPPGVATFSKRYFQLFGVSFMSQ